MATFSTWEQATVKPLPWSPIRCRGARGFPLEEPNREYLANYSAFLKTKAHLRSGLTLAAGFDEIDEAAADSGEKLPLDGSIDLGLAMHMLYFVEDLSASVTRMVRFLKPGGVLFVVVTDETVAYTGLALKSFVNVAVKPATMRGISRSSPNAAACWDYPRKLAVCRGARCRGNTS